MRAIGDTHTIDKLPGGVYVLSSKLDLERIRLETHWTPIFKDGSGTRRVESQCSSIN